MRFISFKIDPDQQLESSTATFEKSTVNSFLGLRYFLKSNVLEYIRNSLFE
ncbi:hypothetical protein X747_29240 [Mesorhizobium sp. LNJC384A00]|nr:hypothetical protein X766_08480 [Mesorhizobium sp. LSJC255A00]ESX30093.1 hypothetical protein X763_29685 [Mesorhizobium sp. LSHC432A00]ESX31206.1 hypothetical protein X764_30420 [Mesorhizobium sp. LSHC440A00]ESX78420.1 hypothetical protein X757_07685 [Mesorhizobium sp. LSHC414A00]ESY24749.1 hypothetical protein X749_26865 [Mesorhizobium sp. LNJC391B00]ESY34716.1 hypothetical protein X747_29240 [Mesorhizobium sp. LNJC384A00]